MPCRTGIGQAPDTAASVEIKNPGIFRSFWLLGFNLSGREADPAPIACCLLDIVLFDYFSVLEHALLKRICLRLLAVLLFMLLGNLVSPFLNTCDYTIPLTISSAEKFDNGGTSSYDQL